MFGIIRRGEEFFVHVGVAGVSGVGWMRNDADGAPDEVGDFGTAGDDVCGEV